MTMRAFPAAILVATALAVACDRTETSNARVTTSTPSGTSSVPSAAAARQRNDALVRVVHAVPSGSSFDLFVGDLMLFDGLAFKTVTPYRAVDGKRYAFALRPAGMAQAKPLSSNTEELNNGKFYTAIAMPGDGYGPQLRVVSDHLDSPSAGKARLRVVHAAGDAGTIDIRAASRASAFFDTLAYQTVSEYRDVEPVNGQLEIIAAGQAAPVLASTMGHLEAGRFYTLVVVGSPSAPTKVEAFLIEDALSP
jgi:hypothetical protein